jgi:hypothetical protein
MTIASKECVGRLHKPTKCALCSGEAVAIYYLDQGCVAYPDLTVQPLCSHHENRATPLGGMELLKDLRVDEGARILG